MKLNNLIKNQLKEFENIIELDLIKHQFEIDCANMPRFENFDFWKRKEGFFGTLFTKLDTLSGPCIYWFEFETSELTHEIKEVTNKFREKKKEHGRTIPAKNKNFDSKYLYVGIRQGGTRKDGFSNIAGRIFHHLGYYTKGSTQGLQLVHWSKHMIKLSIIELPKKGKPYLNIIEKIYANSLKPILGKH
jgi:hypothetical protein